MLGEMLGEQIGHITGMRALQGEDGAAVVEVAVQAQGTLLLEHVSDIQTYTAVQRADGTLAGHGRGVVMTESGATLTWTAQGIGTPTGRGSGISWRGALFYTTTSEKFARLTRQPMLFEYEQDETGKTEGKIWEWK